MNVSSLPPLVSGPSQLPSPRDSKFLPSLKPLAALVKNTLSPTPNGGHTLPLIPLPKHPLPPLIKLVKEDQSIKIHLPPLEQSSNLSGEQPIKIETKIIKYSNGDQYRGEVKGNKRWGTGKIFNSKSELYQEGVYENDLLEGYGFWNFQKDLYYEGILKAGKFHGYGTISNQKGAIVFRGHFEKGLKANGYEPLDALKFFIGSYDKNGNKSDGHFVEYTSFTVLYRGSFKDDLFPLQDSESPKISPVSTTLNSPSSTSSNSLPSLQRKELLETTQTSFIISKRIDNDNISYLDGSTYHGATLNDKREGYGKMIDADGNEIYNGFYKDNLKEGFGIEKFPDGSTYWGLYSKDLRHGFGEYDSKHFRMVGRFSSNHFESGKESIYESQQDFLGHWIDGKKSEGAILDSKDSSLLYYGKFQNDQPHGSPITWMREDGLFKGNCFAGKFVGTVNIKLKDGKEWNGSFLNDVPHGEGTMKDGQGNFLFRTYYSRGEQVSGILLHSPNKYYHGPLKNHLPHGQGSIKSKDGKKEFYQGGFMSGMKHGLGKEYDAEGNLEYIGEFSKNKRHGKGRLYNKKGLLLFDGKFKNDKKVIRDVRGCEKFSSSLIAMSKSQD